VARFFLTIFRLSVVATFAFALYLSLSAPTDSSTDNQSIPLSEVQKLLPAAELIVPPERANGWSIIVKGRDTRIGFALNTWPLARDVTGFGGPVPVLIVTDLSGVIIGCSLLANNETPELVATVVEAGLLDKWNSVHWSSAREVAVDAVSGATLTCMAIRDSLRTRLLLTGDSPSTTLANIETSKFFWGWIPTCLLIIVGLYLCFAPGRVQKRIRPLMIMLTIGWLGLACGTFLSQAYIFSICGSFSGWRLLKPPGLLLILAILVPVISGRPLYCNHLCPHGAAQELIGKISSRTTRLSHHTLKALISIPSLILLALLFLVILGMPAAGTAWAEPFSAFLVLRARFSAIPLTAIILALLSLLLSIFFKRPWCRFACPTGALLRFLRRPSPQARFEKSDLLAGAAALSALLLAWMLG
jgi:FMN-binding domain/4Fe-4S binding domain